MFKINYSKQAKKFLRNLDKINMIRIIEKIEKLIDKPIISDSKFVEGFKEKLYRIRVGDFRILYEVDYNGNLIAIVKIDKRSNVYN